MTVEGINFDSNIPIYLQIAEYVRFRVFKGILKAGERIPSVRELALMLGANPNTVQKAYMFLLQEGLLKNKRGIGYFVTEDRKFIEKKRREALLNFVKEVKGRLEKCGFSLEEFKREL